VASRDRTARRYDKEQEKLNKQLQVLQNRINASVSSKTKALNIHKQWIENSTLAIMNEANNAKLNASAIILSLHATNTTSGQPRA
jgi:hypothetical protein